MMPTATLDLPSDRSAAFHARRWVMQQHLRWAFAGRGGPDHLFDDLVLCVSELVTTAVEANATDIPLILDSEADAIRLAMVDRSPGGAAGELVRHGDGGPRTRIIDAVATRWGVDPGPRGQEIWVEFALAPAGGHRAAG
jgi:hypothetical protein